jgi:hypothetical protein
MVPPPKSADEMRRGFVAKGLCAEAVFLGEHLLRSAGVEGFEVVRNHSRWYHTEHSDDHCYVLFPDDDPAEAIVLDFSFRQFLQCDQTVDEGCEVFQYVQETLPPCYVGTRKDLLAQHRHVRDMRNAIYGAPPWRERPPTHWDLGERITDKFDLHASLTRPGYLDAQPAPHQQFVRKAIAALGAPRARTCTRRCRRGEHLAAIPGGEQIAFHL